MPTYRFAAILAAALAGGGVTLLVAARGLPGSALPGAGQGALAVAGVACLALALGLRLQARPARRAGQGPR